MRGRPPTGWRAPGAIGLAALPSRSGDQDGRHRIWATDAQIRCELCSNPGAIFAQFNLTKHSGDGAIATATARAGRLAPFSNEAVGPLGALAACCDRDAIERRLGDARSLLGSRTPLAPAEDTLAGRLFVAFVALVLAAWLRRRMRETGLDGDYTLEGLLDEVETIERYTREGHRPRVLGVTPRQRAVFERLGYDPPATS